MSVGFCQITHAEEQKAARALNFSDLLKAAQDNTAFSNKSAELLANRFEAFANGSTPLSKDEALARSNFLKTYSTMGPQAQARAKQFIHQASYILTNRIHMNLARLPQFKGKFNSSAAIYFSLFALYNFVFDITVNKKVFIHRNPPPEHNKVFILALGKTCSLDDRLEDKGANQKLMGIKIFPVTFTKPGDYHLNCDGIEYTIKANPKDDFTKDRALELARKLAKSQEHVDYDKICKDGTLRTMFAFGHDQKEDDVAQLLDVGLADTAWQSRTDTFTFDLKQTFLTGLKDSDFVPKIAHTSGIGTAFHMVDNGRILRYKRILPKNSGIYKRCPGLSEIAEEIVVLIPGDESESRRTNVNVEDFCKQIQSSGQNAGQCIYFDGSCWSSEQAYNLYAEMIRILKSGEDVSLKVFHSPDTQQMGLIGPELGYQFTMLEGLREGLDFDAVANAPHDTGHARVITPGTAAFERQRDIFEPVIQALSDEAAVIGKIKLIHNSMAGSAEEFN